MSWYYLALAAGFEIAFAMSMKLSEGFTKPYWSLATVVGVVGGIGFLTLAMRTLPVSVAYPIWTAVGSIGTVALGVLLLGESFTLLKAVSIVLIVLGVVGLRAGTV